MAGELLVLDTDDRKVLNFVIDKARRLLENSRREEQFDFPAESPEVYVARLPTNGIPARSGNTPGRRLCDILKCTFSDETDPNNAPTYGFTNVTYPDATKVQQYVYNIYPVKWYGFTFVAQECYVAIHREKFGLWLCEKPKYRLKVKPVATILAGNAGNCRVWIKGADTTEEVSVKLNWMHGGQQISAGKEAIAEYMEDEESFVFTESECE